MSTRSAIEASWRAAQRMANAEGILRGVPATVAGQFLAAADGDARRALGMLPDNTGRFWSLVAKDLAAVVDEDRALQAPMTTDVRRTG